jgi:hypothetical protein
MPASDKAGGGNVAYQYSQDYRSPAAPWQNDASSTYSRDTTSAPRFAGLSAQDRGYGSRQPVVR